MEMRRLLKPDGLLIVADWDRERSSDPGPPARRGEIIDELAAARFRVEPVELSLPYHLLCAPDRASTELSDRRTRAQGRQHAAIVEDESLSLGFSASQGAQAASDLSVR